MVSHIITLNNGEKLEMKGSKIFGYTNYTSITKLELIRGVIEIGPDAYSEHTMMEEVILREPLKVIGYRAFYGCTSLMKIEIPDTVDVIGEDAFSECANMEIIKSNSRVDIKNCFRNCAKLNKIITDEEEIEVVQINKINCFEVIGEEERIANNGIIQRVIEYSTTKCKGDIQEYYAIKVGGYRAVFNTLEKAREQIKIEIKRQFIRGLQE